VNTVILLRIAAIVAAIQGLAHGTLIWTSTPRHGPAERAVIDAMQANHFTFIGVSRSYWDFYFGYAMMGAFTCIVEAVLFWQLSRFVGTSSAAVRAVAGVFILFNIGHAVLAARFFILTPIVFEAVLIVLLGAAIVATGTI
jgi:hypothetical protein